MHLHIHTAKLMQMLAPLVPACASFGPLILLIGILLRTRNSKTRALSWLGNGFLIAGTAMITVAFMHILHRLPR